MMKTSKPPGSVTSLVKIRDYVLPIDFTDLEKVSADVVETLGAVAEAPCMCPEHESWWESLLAEFRAEWARIEGERKALTEPVMSAFRETNDAFRPTLSALTEAMELCKKKIGDYRIALTVERERALAAVFEATAAGDSSAIAKAVEQLPEDQGARWEWVATVTDHTKVPEQFKIVDMAMVKAFTKPFNNTSEIPSIPGVSFERRPVVRAKSKKKGG